MKARLIKPRIAAPERNEPPVEVPIIDTLRSWVREFQATRDIRTRLDFEHIRKLGDSNGIPVD